MSRAYREDDYAYAGSGYECALELVLGELSREDRVLDLGCGCGIPATQVLSQRCRIVGVDLSDVQLRRAQQLIARADLVQADMSRLQFKGSSFAGVVALWSIIHVPLEDQRGLLSRINAWLKPGGFLLATVGFQRWVGSEDDWCGVPGARMYWSHEDRETNRVWIEEAGFAIEEERFIPEGAGGATLILARTPSL